mmetsp:Transcript_26336/g.37409  ORF Transcript_26336/g.37409 Transcript_26336/m.37409 type:complete len:201 (-) Transcript_26336:56-658(-)
MNETAHSASSWMISELNIPNKTILTTYSVCWKTRHNVPQYRAKIQYTNNEDTSPALDATDTKRVQGVLGTLLFYGRAIDSTILPAIGSIATQQSNPTRNIMQAITSSLNYCLYPNLGLARPDSFTCMTNRSTQIRYRPQIARHGHTTAPQHQLQHHERSALIRRGSRISRPFPQRQRSLPNEDCRGRNGTSPTTHPDRNR